MTTKIEKIPSSDGNVWKYVFEWPDAIAESVLYRYPTFENRTVICCSTQSGCPVGCRFCGAGDYFVRSLSAEEIFAQPMHLLSEVGVSPNAIKRLQIMFMSMGEPMLNWQALSLACGWLYGTFPSAALLISTSGPRVDYGPLRARSVEIPTIGLQFSVHESTDEARDNLIPMKGKLRLAEIATEGIAWCHATGRQPFFNYCAHERNVSDADADRLASLFDSRIWQATISVVCERDESVAAANARQKELAAEFQRKLSNRGFATRMFDPAGQDDIGGGCGQLWFVQSWMRNNIDKAKPSVGINLPVVHAPRIGGAA